MEGVTRFVVASAAAARWRSALPALLPLLLAVPALRGSPAAAVEELQLECCVECGTLSFSEESGCWRQFRSQKY